MKITKPVWDQDFQCLTTDCPDTCCAGWQIPVDEESAARFRAMEGELGERLRKALITVDGETQFAEKDGRCVMLNEANLCDLYAQCGEGALCRTCHTHPRFIAQFGARREIMPGLSCPEWVQVYLMREEKVEFVTEETDEEITDFTEIDAAWFFRLTRARHRALELVQDRSLSLGQRIRQLLALAAELDEEEDGPCPQSEILEAYGKRLASLEILTPTWAELLNGKTAVKENSFREAVLEKLLVYDIFRFFLRSVYDFRVLPWVKLAVFHALAVAWVGRGCESKADFCEVARLYSKEIEHSAENQEAIHRSLCRRRGRYSAAGLLKAMAELEIG